MKKVLVVDDDTNFRLSLEDMLKEYSDLFSLASAANGKEAVEILDSEAINLVITDLKMPEMDGFELLAQMSVSHADIPVIVMTAFGTTEIEERIESMGAFQYIEKPIDFDLLLAKIKEGLTAAEKGKISGVSITSFMQLLQLDKKTCTLTVNSGQEKGILYFDKGELLHATSGEFAGQEAALEISCWDPVEIEIQNFCRQKEQIIEAPLGFILIESARMKDERAEKLAEQEKIEKGETTSASEDKGEEFADVIADAVAEEQEVGAVAVDDIDFAASGQAVEIDPAKLAEISELDVDSSDPEAAIKPLKARIEEMEGISRTIICARDGSVLYSKPEDKVFTNYMNFVFTSGEELQAALKINGPQQIVLVRATGEKLLIIPGPEIVVNLGLSSETSSKAVTEELKAIIHETAL